MRILISSLLGLALRMDVKSLGKPCDVNKHSQSLCLVNLISKDTHLVFSISLFILDRRGSDICIEGQNRKDRLSVVVQLWICA